MSYVLAIDPGTTESAYVVIEGGAIVENRKFRNDDMLSMLGARCGHITGHLAVEMVASYGMPVGAEVFETVLWIGRFIQAWQGGYTKVYRRDVKLHLCGSARAKDGNIRQALLDRFGAPGTKKNPGATYGISGDVWSALAVAVTYLDQHQGRA